LVKLIPKLVEKCKMTGFIEIFSQNIILDNYN